MISIDILGCSNFSPHRSRRWRSLFAASLLGLLSWQSAVGAVLPWLYEVEVPVASQSASHRIEAAKVALKELLVRLSGIAEVPFSNEVGEALRSPENYYSQYRYNTDPQDRSLLLRVDFEPSAVLNLIRRAQLPLWRANRPSVMGILSLEGAILTRGSVDNFSAAVRRRARFRGIELILPEDDLGISSSQLRNPSQALRRVADSYDADLLVAGTARLDGAAVGGNWWFQVEGDTQSFRRRAGGIESVASYLVDQIANRLASSYALAGGESQLLEVTVSELTDAQHFADLLRYLNNLEFINELVLTGIRGDVLSARIATAASAQRLLQLLQADGLLVEARLVSNSGAQVSGTSAAVDFNATNPFAALNLRWIGSGATVGP